MEKREPVLSMRDLAVSFQASFGKIRAVRGVNMDVYPGETVAIVGESGSGKTVTSKAVMGLIATPPGEIKKESKILYQGENILEYSEKEWQDYRGKKAGMIFQDPMTSLNPTMKVGRQIAEGILKHEKISKKEAMQKAVELLRKVNIPNPEERANQYPHEFSGGMRQRVVIAIALACNPKLMIADEPTTALDVTIQAQIIKLLKEIQKANQSSIIMITHDLGVVAGMADKIAVMYAGKIVEEGLVDEIFSNPQHPYTWGLMRSLPAFAKGKESLYTIPGMPPTLINPPKGDAFACRNEYALNIDYEEMPPMFKITDTHYAATWLLDPRAPQIKSPMGGQCSE